MTTAAIPHRSLSLAVRYAARELRGGLRGFYVFILCIALGVLAIAAVGSVAASLRDGLAREGRTLLGGDVAFSLIQREASPDELAFLRSRGAISVAATLRSMIKAPDDQMALVELKAVDQAYPLLGSLELSPDMSPQALFAEKDGVFGAAADPTLMARLALKLGDVVSLGNSRFTIRAVLDSEPDKLAGGIGLGPRFLTSDAALRASGMLQPGSLVRWTYRVRLADGTNEPQRAIELADAARAALPHSGWEIRTQDKASPQLERNLARFTQFLTLVGLAALLVGGVGVANAVKSHIDRRRDVIATLKAVGATGRDVFAIYLVQIMSVTAIGAVIGVILGAAVPYLVVSTLGPLLPLPLTPALYPRELILALLYGLLTALAFGLWPLVRIYEVPVAALFRDIVSVSARRTTKRDLLLVGLVALALIAVVIGFAYEKRIAALFVVSSIAVFALLRLVASGVMAIARRLPRPRNTMLRMALANVHRPGALTPTVVMSLGLGLTVLVTISQIDGNLRSQFMSALPDRAPSYFFIDIPSAESARFNALLHAQAPGATVEDVPMLRGRIVAARGVPADQLKPAADAEWVLQSDRGLSYGSDVPHGSQIAEGKWWAPDYAGPPLASMEKRLAEGLGLKVGDDITVNVLGRNVTATIASLRTLDWQSLGINFVLVFSPNTFRGAPHTHLATLTDSKVGPAPNDAALVRAIATEFPMVTSVRVREALDSVGTVITNLTLAIRGASVITLLAAILVLGGALAAGHRYRVYDAVILKTLGATRLRLLAGYALEYFAIGLATATFGVVAGSLIAWAILSQLMHLSFVWQAGAAALIVAAALLVTIGLGLAGTLVALNKRPAAVLRNL